MLGVVGCVGWAVLALAPIRPEWVPQASWASVKPHMMFGHDIRFDWAQGRDQIEHDSLTWPTAPVKSDMMSALTGPKVPCQIGREFRF